MRKLYSIALVLLVFCGSVGIPLYQHTCLHEDITIHTLFTASDHCEAMHEPEPSVPSCCAKEVKTIVEDDHCCTEDVSRLAMNFSFFVNWQLTAAIVPQPELNISRFLSFEPAFPAGEQLFCASDSDPPPLSGRELLHRICILRL